MDELNQQSNADNANKKINNNNNDNTFHPIRKPAFTIVKICINYIL